MKNRFILRAIIVLALVMSIGLSSHAFSRQFNASLGKALGTKNLGAQSVSQVFGGGKVTNIYDNALSLIKDKEVKTAFASLDTIMTNHTEFASCRVTADDIINILYDSNQNFRVTLELTVVNKTKKKVSVPSDKEILKSYETLLRCRTLQTDFLDVSDSQGVTNQINAEYAEPINTHLNQASITDANFGDDIFQNATLDDSDYDLLVDIDKIGKKFFDSFTTPTQTLFYALPSLSSLGGAGSNGGNNGSSSQAGGTFTVLSGGQNSTGIVLSAGITPSIDERSLNGNSVVADPSINAFIDDSNTQLFPPNNLYALPASQCSSGVTADISSPSGSALTPGEYEGYIDRSLGSISANPELDASPTIPLGVTGGVLPSGSPNQRVEDAVDGIGGDCGQTCNGLSDGEQQNCLNNCLESCTAQCDGLGPTDKLYCESQCLCVTVGGPLGENWKGMENMYKIKFCTIPVQGGRVTGGKKVYSIEAIFLTIKNIFQSLVNGGEMIKRTKPKEFFDTSLSEIKFQDIFSFQIVTQTKPLFPSISRTAQVKQLTKTNANYESAILGMTPDDKNKYVIIADIAGSKIDAEQVTDIDDYNKKVAVLKNIQTSSVSALSNVIKNASSQNIVTLNDKIKTFMLSNVTFWNTTSQLLQEINNLSSLLKTNIESKG